MYVDTGNGTRKAQARFVSQQNKRSFTGLFSPLFMTNEERKQLIIHLRMLLAARRTMLRNLDGLLSDSEVNEALDQMLKIEEEIKRLEKAS